MFLIHSAWPSEAWWIASGASSRQPRARIQSPRRTSRRRRRTSTATSPTSEEDREVVGGEGEGRGDPPAGQVAAPAVARGAGAVEQRDGAEERQQRVGARLLRVPEQHRVDRGERRRHQAGAAAAQLGRDQVDDRDRRHPGHGGERAQPELAGAGRLRPDPGERVVERRRRLAEPDRVHRVAEAAAEDAAGGDDLVVVVALDAERDEAQQRRQRGQPGDDPEGARARPHRLGYGDAAERARPGLGSPPPCLS